MVTEIINDKSLDMIISKFEKNYKYILFDLDGTLTDPKIGITKSVSYALVKMGIESPSLDELTKFIGPPLMVSFKEYYGMSEQEVDKAIEFFREYFKVNGMFENEVYEGIKDLLKELKKMKKTLLVATSKPTVFAIKIMEHFEIDTYFDLIVGSNLDGTRANKWEVIEEVISKYPEISSENAVMIGDRKHDIIGAIKVGLDSIGVEYGYGSYEELIDAGATYVVKDVLKLKSLLLG